VKKECLTPVKGGKPSSVTYLWQGATLAEEWQTYPDNNGGSSKPIQVNRWHFEPGAFKPLAKETLHQAGNNTRVLEREGFYPIVTDHLGTPKELFSTAGECLWQAEHSLWGKTSVVFQRKQKQRDSFGRETQADSPWPVVDCSLRFQNQWEDKESGLYYNLNRYYDPESGQYLSQDPIKLAGGLRSHGYVHNPMQWVDPWGLAGCAQTGTDVPDEALVRVDPTRLDKSISELGIQRRFFSDKKVWLTKYGDIKNVNNAKEFETMLYRKDLWPKVEGRFSEGATLRVVNNADDAVAAGLTNKTNGVRQWRITRDVSPDDLRVIGRLD
jgi:RHS repeat-associated protein